MFQPQFPVEAATLYEFLDGNLRVGIYPLCFLATAHAVYSRLLCRIELPRITGKVVAKGRQSVKRTKCLCAIPTFLAALRSHDQALQHPHIQHLRPWGCHERYDSRERQAA